MEILIFEIDARQHALLLSTVQEVVRAVAVTPLPGAPPIVDGMINVRGRVVPVLDLRRRFAPSARPVRVDEHFVIARAGARTVAIRAEPATRLATVDATAIDRAANIGQRSRHVTGVAKLPDGLALIHDLTVFLSHAESESLDQALLGRSPANAGN